MQQTVLDQLVEQTGFPREVVLAVVENLNLKGLGFSPVDTVYILLKGLRRDGFDIVRRADGAEEWRNKIAGLR